VKVSSNPAALKKPAAVTSLPQKKVVPQPSIAASGGHQIKGSTVSKVSKHLFSYPH